MNSENNDFMREAIQLSIKNIENGGGPFGAVIVKDNEVIATGVNRVTIQNDPTAHAEISAIRSACTRLERFDLSDCEIFTSCEPCPMCLGAIYWARIQCIYYGNSKHDAASINFDDDFIYKELALAPDQRHIKAVQLLREEASSAFNKWSSYLDKSSY